MRRWGESFNRADLSWQDPACLPSPRSPVPAFPQAADGRNKLPGLVSCAAAALNPQHLASLLCGIFASLWPFTYKKSC